VTLALFINVLIIIIIIIIIKPSRPFVVVLAVMAGSSGDAYIIRQMPDETRNFNGLPVSHQTHL